MESYRTGRVVRLALVAALGGLLFGWDSAVINGATSAIKETFHLGDAGLGLVVAIALLGSAVGAWFTGALADRFGRRTIMLVSAAGFFIAAIGQAFPFGTVDLMFWRLVGGAAIGIASVAAPMYISEIAPASIRGRLTSLQQFAIVIGIFLTGLVNFLILNAAGGSSMAPWLFGLAAWHWMFLSLAIPAIAYFVLALRIPQSPRWLVEVGRNDDARKVLESIYTSDVSPILTSIQGSLGDAHKPRLSDLKGPRFGLLPIVWVGIILSVLQQFVGINAVFYYSNTIWEAVGFAQDKAFFTSLINTGVNVVFTIVAIALIDRVGRKPLLIVGSAGMSVTLLALTIVFATAPRSATGAPMLADGPDLVAVLALNLYVAFFAATWGPVVWVLLGEMFPNRIRAAALALGAAAQWLANFVVSTTFPALAGVSLGIAYGLFTVFALLSIPFVLAKVKETKGVALEDMGRLDGVPASA